MEVAWSLFVAAMFSICGNETQTSRFVVTGSGSHSLSGAVGDFARVHGQTLPPAGDGPDPVMIYAIVIVEGIAPNGSGGGGGGDKIRQEFHWFYSTPAEKVTVSCTWNCASDVVTVDGKTFQRSAGNSFLIVRAANGQIISKQLGTVDGSLEEDASFAKIKALLPKEHSAISLR